MLTRKAWPVALSVVFVGSVAVIVQGSDELPLPATPARPVEKPALTAPARNASSPTAARQPTVFEPFSCVVCPRIIPELLPREAGCSNIFKMDRIRESILQTEPT